MGYANGKAYKLIHARRSDQVYCDARYSNEWRWFLWSGGITDDFYDGDFRTKAEALNFLERGEL